MHDECVGVHVVAWCSASRRACVSAPRRSSLSPRVRQTMQRRATKHRTRAHGGEHEALRIETKSLSADECAHSSSIVQGMCAVHRLQLSVMHLRSRCTRGDAVDARWTILRRRTQRRTLSRGRSVAAYIHLLPLPVTEMRSSKKCVGCIAHLGVHPRVRTQRSQRRGALRAAMSGPVEGRKGETPCMK
jgi:hypothetical protein